MGNMTIVKCSNCGKYLYGGDKEYCEENNVTECAECRFHAMNGTRTIDEYNAWLKRGTEGK